MCHNCQRVFSRTAGNGCTYTCLSNAVDNSTANTYRHIVLDLWFPGCICISAVPARQSRQINQDVHHAPIVQEYERENASKEAAFQAAVTAVKQAASEQELDERVIVALTSLDLYDPHILSSHSPCTLFPHSNCTASSSFCIAASR